jgi:hypothetical protein
MHFLLLKADQWWYAKIPKTKRLKQTTWHKTATNKSENPKVHKIKRATNYSTTS